MFSSAFKSISATNITGNYSISSAPTSTAGPWKIYDAKKKSTGKPYSVFVFDRKSLDTHGSSLGRSGAASFKKTVEEVVERLKKEASSLAKLRHPNILELVEPVEETRGGGLQFVTESVTASLSSLLQEKDEQERAGGPGGRSSRYVTEDADGTKRRRELEIDELEIQKGLLQVSKALEFLHENAGIVHGNLTPDASDWKISGLAFASPPEGSDKPTSIQGINLYEVLNMDPRLPKAVQLNLDYSSPDFVVDNNLNSSADMFSLGLMSVALYNSPHRSPLECHGSLSTYKRQFSSSSSVPSASNNYLSSRPLPRELSHDVLPRLITRRPAQRMTAREFQQSEYFDNILVSTIRFLDSFPAKTANEKASFMRGLNKVLPSFPKSVMEKKILPALIEELKDRDLLSLILQNIFKILDLLPSAKRAFSEKVRPALREIFVVNAKQTQEKDPARDAGLMVVLEHISSISSNCSGKEFKDDMLPVIMAAIECPTHSIVDAALRSLPVVLPVLDFSTIKNELFPVIAAVFSKTNSLAIKVRGLRAFVILCGGTNDNGEDDGLNGLENKKTSSSSALDKYTMQEKIVPLIRVIKTKEPAVMMAALNVLRVVGSVADAEFVAMEILPILWSMSLGPLLNLKQFQGFMELIKSLSRRVEDEQTRKLQELGGPSNGATAPSEDFMAFGGVTGTTFDQNNGATKDDFENLVKGRMGSPRSSTATPSWDDPAKSKSSTPAPTFSWSTPPPPANNPALKPPAQNAPSFRTVTPDLGRFEALTPSSTQFSQPLQPIPSQPFQPPAQLQQQPMALQQPLTASTSGSSINCASTGTMGSSMANMSLNSTSRQSSFTLPPPPGNTSTTPSSFTMTPPPTTNWSGMSSMSNTTQHTTQNNTGQKSGLDKYESLI
ncbi:related to bovine rhodopsin kinase and to YGR052w [Fusarium fujikuroi IMI 58289]|uniref:Related to bovine rhodopsin kinase and to YGR052w n=1 Tax=Gibberella fujikuroi (strain CBS 195.34 / IMI 58289 / NRRL A-6831) TaxID=1279085 RepID=S0DPN0_GIBF5|nr:related to bovine rhodopsin kinase and to YGR052w [Fusarium fujikuroi IMI 58289]CCT64401.1 related to bovine rhodopsin kinase and to YGR052w [Fusarium fujikuroi IMI 58289]